MRTVHVGLLFVLLWTAWQVVVGFQEVHRVGDLSFFNELLFQLFAITQLIVTLFVASLSGASAISHEKDRRTFILLLITRLQDSEIVVNKFLCGLLQISIMMLATVPVYFLTIIFGGVSLTQILQAVSVNFGAAVSAASLGVLLACWREKTYQAVTLTLLGIVFFFLLAPEVAARWAMDPITGALPVWLEAVSPWRAVRSVFDLAHLDRPFPVLGHPSWAYLVWALLLSSFFLTAATIWLRVWNPKGEPIQQPDFEETRESILLQKSDVGAKTVNRSAENTGKSSRQVWTNPVLWREVMTRAHGARTVLIKFGYLLIGAVFIGGLMTLQSDAPSRLVIARAIFPLVVLSLLIINAQAVTAVTAERDLKAIDLLLATDITPREFIYGKLFGVLYNVKEMLFTPALLSLFCFYRGWISPIDLVYTLLLLLVSIKFATVLGVHSGLRHDTTRLSLGHSLGTMFLLSLGILILVGLIIVSGRFEAQWASFILFIVMGSLGLWVSLSANAPSNAIALTAAMLPFATFYCVIAFLVGDRGSPFLVATGVYGFGVAALLIPLLAEFDIATGRTTMAEG